jgi:hypothetical protein
MLSDDLHLDDLHLSDQELLLVADGELPQRHADRARLHLAACRTCRARMGKIKNTLTDFTRLHNDGIHSHSDSVASSRALLRARLTEIASRPRPGAWPFFLPSALAGRIAACVSAVVLVATLGMLVTQRHRLPYGFKSAFTGPEYAAVPNRTLTPGAIRSVTLSDVCTEQREQTASTVPISVQRKIFQEYGIADAPPRDYELDYLVTPELGGTDDPRNLWPQPHSATVWNSYVKDALEDRLHHLVCNGSLDLVTAQHDIETDWIAAYKKYFHTDRPSPVHSGLVLNPHRAPNG